LFSQNSLKQEEVEELQAAFNLFSNKKKEMDADDLKSVMRQLGRLTVMFYECASLTISARVFVIL